MSYQSLGPGRAFLVADEDEPYAVDVDMYIEDACNAVDCPLVVKPNFSILLFRDGVRRLHVNLAAVQRTRNRLLCSGAPSWAIDEQVLLLRRTVSPRDAASPIAA